jgi:hypothetical protein
VLAAAVVAVVHGLDPVLDHPAPLAMEPAATELGVERVEDLSGERGQLHGADQRHDVRAGEVLVRRPRGALHLKQSKVLLQELPHRRRGTRIQPVVDLYEKTTRRLLGLVVGIRASPDDLLQVVAFLRDGVLARVDEHAA